MILIIQKFHINSTVLLLDQITEIILTVSAEFEQSSLRNAW
jgi:hypothetical protein